MEARGPYKSKAYPIIVFILGVAYYCLYFTIFTIINVFACNTYTRSSGIHYDYDVFQT